MGWKRCIDEREFADFFDGRGIITRLPPTESSEGTEWLPANEWSYKVEHYRGKINVHALGIFNGSFRSVRFTPNQIQAWIDAGGYLYYAQRAGGNAWRGDWQ